MNQVADNSIRTFSSLDQLDRVRVTQVKTFHECPARWKAEVLGHGTPYKSKYAAIGTALHAVIERYLRGDFELFTKEWEDQMLWLDANGVNSKERLGLLNYITKHLAPIRQNCFSIEDEFRLSLVPDAPDIVGHRDCLFHEPNAIVIRDHKSNRQFEGVEHWRAQFQPLLYALGTARQYPGRNIIFEIGYILLGEVVRWVMSPEDITMYETYLTKRYQEMWDEIRVYKRTGQWPERINDHCSYCPLRNECSTLVWSHQDFMRSFTRSAGDTSLGERLEWAKAVQSTINHKVDELKEELIAEIKANDGASLYVGNKLYSLRKAKRREVKWPALWSKLWEITQTLPADQQTEMWNRIMERLNDMVSVKVGNLSEFLLEYPQYSEPVNAIIESVESETVSLQVKDAPLVTA